MVLIFSVLGYETVRLHREDLEEATYSAGHRISDTIRRSTRFSMLNNSSEQVHQILQEIGAQQGIKKIRIFNKLGDVRFSTEEGETSLRVDMRSEECRGCHGSAGLIEPRSDPGRNHLGRSNRTRIYADANGERVLGVISPIGNEPSCSSADCHAHPPDAKMLGMVDVTMSLARVDAATAESGRQMTIYFIAAIAAISLLVVSLVLVMVHRPGRQLLTGMRRVASGDLDYKIDISSRDELGELASSFNSMTGRLKKANAEISDWARTLEMRVEEKTAELKQAHAHIVRVEKMASIGKLAAIVAHEINNPLAGILVYAKLLLKRASRNGAGEGEGDDTKKHLEMIASESARCGEIVKNLLQFSRQTRTNLEPSEINQIITQSVRLVQHKIDLMGVKTELRLDPDLKLIVCDAQQIRQAIIALLINACEAMKQDEGVLRIESKYLPASRMAEISISDNGVGMDEETKKLIFEPFFTTKEHGKGVGLGLAVVYGIVNGHAGEIEVQSEPGRGTSFIIRLHEQCPASAVAANEASD
jgi:two-component system NtrC family sensor kinase